MDFINQNETLINLVFCITIVILGYLVHKKRKDTLIVYVMASFGLFGLSHYFNYTDIAQSYESFLLVVRSVAYGLIIIAFLNLKKGNR